jgi:hypothetical protein
VSKAGRAMAFRLADNYMQKTGISKAFGARDALADGLFALPGEVVAVAVAEKKKTAKANSKLLRQYKRQADLQERTLVNLRRAQDLDDRTLRRAESLTGVSVTDVRRRADRRLRDDDAPFARGIDPGEIDARFNTLMEDNFLGHEE